MLIDFSVQNFSSFNSTQELNMLPSTTTQEACDLNNTHAVDMFGIKSILQSAAIFGSNGSGKTNFIDSLQVFKNLVLGSLDSVTDSAMEHVIPFLLKENHFDVPTEFEISFIAEENLYRYGMTMEAGEIAEEWLYWTKTTRETMLFHRVKQTVNYNQRSFSEAKLFVKKDGDTWAIEKTKPFVPFLSVLSQFDGERSSVVTNWFNKLNIISGIREGSFKRFTIELFEEDEAFKLWALEILKSLQIDNLHVVEYEKEFPLSDSKKPIEDKELSDVFTKLQGIFEKKSIKDKRIEVVKTNQEGESFSLPLGFESEGTRKLIYLLGPLYDVIKNNEILVVDEFDNKFHTLLSKFIIELYNKHNFGKSQLILTCHDTNLLTNELFRRDQIWFIEKNKDHESELFSLVEYKEHYTRKDKSFSRDYLLGKYGAIPLFSSISEMEELMNG
jgi:AAA15 family ATPase/GTPase